MTRSARRALAALLAVVAIVALSPTQAQASSPRVIGGNPIEITAAPWQVLLRINGTTQCGGAIISETWLLTAAHCVSGVSAARVEAYVGVTDQNRLTRDHLAQVNQVIVNPNWNSSTYSSDLALLGLAAPLAFSASVQPVALPLVQDANTWPAASEQATISGWGSTTTSGPSSAILRAATVQILSAPTEAKCGEYGSSYVPGNHVCAGMPQGGVDACQGDSGGPLTVAYNGTPVLAGIVSSGSGCADPKYPGLYSRVTSFLPWLRQYVVLPKSPPGAPTNVQVKALQGGRAFVSWDPPVNDGGAAMSYVASSSADERSCSADVTSCVISGLTTGTTYTFTVTSGNSIGLSAPSAASSAIVAVSGTGRVGSTVRKANVLRWADSASGKIFIQSKSQCRLSNRGVVLTRAGYCSVKVTGSSKRVVILAVA